MTIDNTLILEYEETDTVKEVQVHQGDVMMVFPCSEQEAATILLSLLEKLYPNPENVGYIQNLRARIERGTNELQ